MFSPSRYDIPDYPTTKDEDDNDDGDVVSVVAPVPRTYIQLQEQ